MLVVLDEVFKLASHDVLKKMLDERDVVDNFQRWYSANVGDMTSTVALTAIKAFLVAYRLEEAVTAGLLKETLGDVAKDVVARLARFHTDGDRDGLRCAMGMFLSLWENHHHTRNGDGMALAIQRRFWFSYARWNTLKRLGKFFVARSFTENMYRNSAMQDCVKVSLNETVARKYSIWIHRMIYFANQTKTMGDDDTFEFDPDTMSFHVARLAFLVVSHFPELVMDNGHANRQLTEAADVLVPLMDNNLQGNVNAVRDMLHALVNFANVYHTWWAAQGNTVVLRLQELIYTRRFMLAMGSTIHTATIEMMRLNYIILDGAEEAENFCVNSPVLRALEESKTQGFWSDELPAEKVNHEILLDPNFTLKPSECYMQLERRYLGDNVPSTSASALLVPMLVDMRAALLRCCRIPVDSWGIVRTFDIDRVRADSSFLGSEFGAYMDVIVVNFALPLVRDPQLRGELRAHWEGVDKNNMSVALSAAFHLVRGVRVHEENIAINMLRTANVMHRRDMILRRLPKTNMANTKAWFMQMMPRMNADEMTRLRAGDPFMMLSFVNKAFTDLVWDNERLTEGLLPEVLCLDADRVRNVRCLIEGVSDFPEARRVFTEVVVADRVPRSARFTPVPDFMLAARKLRRVVLVCRTVHGPTMSTILTECVLRPV